MEAKVLPIRESDEKTCRTKDGATAAIEHGRDGEERIVLRDGEQRVLVEYVAESSQCVIHALAGDLVLRSEGAIELDAVRGIRLNGGPQLDLEADKLTTSADEAEVTIASIRVTADVLEGLYRRVRNRVDILETRAGRVVEQAKETYREVQSLAQIKAGRLRLVAEKTVHVLGTQTLLKAHEDIKLQGDKIHLG